MLLSAALDRARASDSRIVWIEGEPGIGKTAFVRRFVRTAEDVVLLEASGDESETTLDYGVVQQLVARSTPVPSWTELQEQIAERSPAGSFAVGADLLSMLGSAQDEAPVIIVIDDAQWLDSSSADAMLFALRRLHRDRVLVLIASRPDGLAHLGPSWARLVDDPDRVQRVRLSGLTGPEVNHLADSLGKGQLTRAAGERLREHTRGHPLHVKALLSELSPERLNFGDGELPAPRSFAATVLSRLSSIGAEVQDLVAAAAVAGPRSPLAFVASVAGLDDASAAVEEATAQELLVLTPNRLPEEITFPHPLVRAAVYDDLSPRRRRTLHLACAELASGATALAHRVAASPGDDDELADELESAGEAEVSAGRLTAGVQRLLWASRIAASPAVRERTLLRSVECMALAGDVLGASSRLDAVLACRESSRRGYTIGLLTAVRGRLPEAEGALRELLARPDYQSDPELEAPVTASLAITCALLGRGEEAIRSARQALEVSPAPATARTTAAQALGLGLVLTGRGEEAIEMLGSLSASRIEPEPFEAELLTTRASFKAWWGDVPGAAEDFSAVIRWSRAGAPPRALPNAYGGLAEVEYRLGRWDDGLTHAELAVSLGEDSYRVWDLAFVHAVAGYLTAARGDWAAATEHADAAQRAAEATPLPMCQYSARATAVHLAWVRGEWDGVLEALGPLQVLITGSGPAIGFGQRFVQSMAAEAMLLTGALDDAEALLNRIEAHIDETLGDPTRIGLWRLRAMLAQARRRPAAARDAFHRGEQAAGLVQGPLEVGLLELAHGQFLRRTGSRRAAISALRGAADRFGQLGARPFLARCEAELTACGVPSPAHRADNRYGLTPREDLVARMVASGKSNREVAEELYLSTKAIEYHLGNVFAKVNIRSRHDLASRLAGSDLGADPAGRPPGVPRD